MSGIREMKVARKIVTATDTGIIDKVCQLNEPTCLFSHEVSSCTQGIAKTRLARDRQPSTARIFQVVTGHAFASVQAHFGSIQPHPGRTRAESAEPHRAQPSGRKAEVRAKRGDAARNPGGSASWAAGKSSERGATRQQRPIRLPLAAGSKGQECPLRRISCCTSLFPPPQREPEAGVRKITTAV